VYICLCNALTDRRLKQVMADGASATPAEVYAACGCRAQCGRCVRAVIDMLRDQVPSPETGLQTGN
jgi:bacterioferritin-associated ferredoxin